jgi:CO/xanthine dehydrogenase Mo-binding subunit
LSDEKRLNAVLLKAAELNDWRNKSSIGTKGIACAFYKTSYAAHVAEVIKKDGKIKLSKITAVLDCGQVINSIGVKAQMEGAMSDAISVSLKSNINIEYGIPQEINYDLHPVTRYSDMPDLVLHIIDSNEAQSGAGEPPFPSVPPAIAKAVFRLTGKEN